MTVQFKLFLNELVSENEFKELLTEKLVPPPCSIRWFTYESEESINEVVKSLVEKENRLQEELEEIMTQEEMEAWKSDILDAKCQHLLKDKGVIYMRFCELVRTMRSVLRVMKSQTATDFASDLQLVV